MSDAPVVFDRVWKKFRRGQRHDSLRDLVPSAMRRLARRPGPEHVDTVSEFWALRDVSFEIPAGTALGIIGPNGAGKSTTLKLLTRILRPTEGSCRVKGRVGALIEVAAGFHPDLTGRENIYLQGAVMGMKRAEIAARISEIIDFAGVGDFIDTQVKRYSSGMNARLGFSIAAHLEPDVLVIDEVLSVGDMDFQQRCVARMQDFKRRGVTIVFVSHDLQAVSRLCDRALLLNHSVAAFGPTATVTEAYVRSSASADVSTSTASVQIVSATLNDPTGRPVTHAVPGQTLRLRVTYETRASLQDLHLGFLVHRSTDGLLVYDASIAQEAVGKAVFESGQRYDVDYFFKAHLTRGLYHVELHVLHTPTFQFLARLKPAAVFNVAESFTFAGVANLDVQAQLAGPRTELEADNTLRTTLR